MKRKLIFVVLIFILALNYYKTFDVENTAFANFRSTSQILAEFSIFAGANKMDKAAYGLGKIEYPGKVTSDGLDLNWIEEEKIDINTLTFRPYKSQIGLQGTIYYYLAKILPLSYKTIISLLMKVCALLMAIVAFLIVWLLNKKIGNLMSICYYIIFLLSPWLCLYGRDLYWVEFTWFLPMLIGIIFSMVKDKTKKWCYVGAFVSILVKSLCGYEYVTTIMMSLVLFPFMECVIIDKEMRKKLFKQVVLLGVFAFLGFVTALLIHGILRGDGNIITGIKEIYYGDILRRTVGINGVDADVSVISVLIMYLRFPTQIITGVGGNIFPYLIISVATILIYKRFYIQKPDAKIEFLVLFSFLTSISWFVLAKDHSYNHPHMNYVLWYFGFIQMCLYVVLDFVASLIKQNNTERM